MNSTHPKAGEITSAVIELFKTLPTRLAASGARGNRAWTTQIKDDIGTLAGKYDYTVCAGGFKPRWDGGWLYDLSWYRNNEEGHLHEVYLVLESEWGSNKLIKYDFEKLLLAKSALKVMVFQARTRDIEKLCDFLRKGIRVFPNHSADETYLFMAFNNDTNEFDIRKFNGAGDPLP